MGRVVNMRKHRGIKIWSGTERFRFYFGAAPTFEKVGKKILTLSNSRKIINIVTLNFLGVILGIHMYGFHNLDIATNILCI